MSQSPPQQPNPYGSNQPGAGQPSAGQYRGAPTAQPDAQQYGPPQYGAPPGTYQPDAYQTGGQQPGNPPGGALQKRGVSRRLLLLVGGVILVLLIGSITTLLVVNRTTPENRPATENLSTPEKTIRDYVAATKARDCQAILKLLTENERSNEQFWCGQIGPGIDEAEVQILKVTETGDSAKVDVSWKVSDVVGNMTYSLVRMDGKWLIESVPDSP